MATSIFPPPDKSGKVEMITVPLGHAPANTTLVPEMCFWDLFVQLAAFLHLIIPSLATKRG